MTNNLQNRITAALASGARQLVSVFMIFAGLVLATNAAMGPCGGTALAVEPFPAIFVSVFGLELILCSYAVVKTLKVESSFRVIVYLNLVLFFLSDAIPIVLFSLRSAPRTPEDVNEVGFSLLRGLAACVNLIVFYRWVGVKKMITRVW